MTRYGVDIDGVLSDFNEAYIRVMTLAPNQLSAETMAKLREPWPNWSWMDDLVGAENRKWFWRHAVVQYGVFAGAMPIGNELSHLERLPGEKFLVTSRPRLCREQTYAWLGNYRVNVEGVLHANKPGEKREFIEALKLDFYVDDHPETVFNLIKDGVQAKCYVFDQPWNRDVKAPRIKSLEELL